MATKKTAKRKKSPAKPQERAWLSTAVFCEAILRETNNMSSLIRMLDVITINGPAESMPPGIISMKLYLEFKSDGITGKKPVSIEAVSPTGNRIFYQGGELSFKGSGSGAALLIDVQMGIKVAGLYWFEVSLESELRTRMPLQVIYRQQSSEASPDSEEGQRNGQEPPS